LDYYECNSYPIENVLVAITKSAEDNTLTPPLTPDIMERDLETGYSYGEGLRGHAEELQRHLSESVGSNESIAIFGAGHIACMYINLMGIEDYIEFVVDDNPHKKGLYMPGSKIPIVSSENLYNSSVSLCLLSLSPAHEEKIISRHKDFMQRGGRIRSIFPSSNCYLFNEVSS
jgi:hypothetical protein